MNDENKATNENEMILSNPSISNNFENKNEVQYFNGIEISKLSKRQLKKYTKCLKWQEIKKEKRLKEKNKLKEKRKIQKLSNIDMGPSRKELKRRPKMRDSSCKISVCIDLSFDHLMIDKVSITVSVLLIIFYFIYYYKIL